jgi:hypothetical protein
MPSFFDSTPTPVFDWQQPPKGIRLERQPYCLTIVSSHQHYKALFVPLLGGAPLLLLSLLSIEMAFGATLDVGTLVAALLCLCLALLFWSVIIIELFCTTNLQIDLQE